MQIVGKGRYWLVLLFLIAWGVYMLWRAFHHNEWRDFLFGFMPGVCGIYVALYGIHDGHEGDRNTQKVLKQMREERDAERREMQGAVRAMMGERVAMAKVSEGLITERKRWESVISRLENEWLIKEERPDGR